MSLDTLSGEQAKEGNYLSRKVFEGNDLEKLKSTYAVETGLVSWDVGVPLLDGRPVIDRNHIDPTQIRKSRGTLSIFSDPTTSDLRISVGSFYQSAYDKTPIQIGPPLVGDEAQGLCAPSTENGVFEGFDLTLQSDGMLTFAGISQQTTGEPVELFKGSSPHDATYAHLINYAERMITIPVAEGHRRPIEPVQ